MFDQVSAEYGWRDEEILDIPLARLRQISDTIARRQELLRYEQLKIAEWQARSIATFVASAAGAWGDSSELVQAAQELSITGDSQEPDRRPAAPVRIRSGREEWEQAAAAKDAGGEVDGEMTGVPAGVPIDDLPEMTGVPVSGPQQQAGEQEVRGAGARIGAAEGLINALERGLPPQ